MLNKTLFKRELKSNYKLILLFLIVLTMYAVMIVGMFDPKLGDSLKTMAESMPQLFSAFGMNNMSSTLLEFIANYMYGFLLIIFPIVFIILLSGRLIIRYVDKGSMAYLLATPNNRRKIVTTQALFLAFSCLILDIYVTVVCILSSVIFFPGDLDISKFIVINVCLYGLYIFLSGLCFASSCIFNDTKYSYGVGSGLCILFVLIKLISQVNDKSEFLKYATPLSLFNTNTLMEGTLQSYFNIGILYIVGIILYHVGITRFIRKDLFI